MRLAELVLPALEVLLGELPHRLDGERARAQRRLADRQLEDLLRRGAFAVLVEQLLERLGDDEPGQHLGRVVRRRLLALAAGEPEDEGALRGAATGFALPRDRVGGPSRSPSPTDASARVTGTTHEPFSASPSLATS